MIKLLTNRFSHFWVGALIAGALLCAIFPDVVFSGASLRITDQLNGGPTQLEKGAPFPVAPHTEWWSGQADTGGAAFQSEPIAEFIKSAFWSGDSIYWNPYAATGAMGPESLVDLKFSLFTILYALMGGGSLAYNIIYIGAYFLGLVALYGCVRLHLRMSTIAAIGSCIFFVANGYVAASMGSNVALSYPYAPVLLFAALAIIRSQNALTTAMFGSALAVLMSFTFLPTTITTLLTVATIAGAVLASHLVGVKDKLRVFYSILLCIIFGATAAALVVSPIYFPVIENLGNTGTLEDYKSRLFYGLYFPQAVTAFFSPSLFFESYNAMEERARAYYAGFRSFPGNTVYHMGIAAILLSISGLRLNRRWPNLVQIACMLLVAATVTRLFNPDFIEHSFAKIPVLGNIGYQYWWPCIVIPMTILVGYGVDAVKESRANIVALVVLVAAFVAAGLFVWTNYGLAEPNLAFKEVMLIVAVTSTAAVCALIVSSRYLGPKGRVVVAGALLVLMFSELAISSKAVRYPRNDFFTSLPTAVQFVKDNVGLQRTLNFGQTGLYPELGSALGIQEVGSMSSGSMPAYLDYFYSAIDLDLSQRVGVGPIYPRGAFPSLFAIRDEPETNHIDLHKLDLLGVKYLLVPANFVNYRDWFMDRGFTLAFQSPATFVLENPTPNPRSFFIPLAESIVGDEISLPENVSEILKPSNIATYRNASLTLTGTADESGIVVLTDAWHPLWSAEVNAAAVPIVRVDGTFRGVRVEPGPYTITMNYEPKSLPVATLLSIFGCLILAGSTALGIMSVTRSKNSARPDHLE